MTSQIIAFHVVTEHGPETPDSPPPPFQLHSLNRKKRPQARKTIVSVQGGPFNIQCGPFNIQCGPFKLQCGPFKLQSLSYDMFLFLYFRTATLLQCTHEREFCTSVKPCVVGCIHAQCISSHTNRINISDFCTV